MEKSEVSGNNLNKLEEEVAHLDDEHLKRLYAEVVDGDSKQPADPGPGPHSTAAPQKKP